MNATPPSAATPVYAALNATASLVLLGALSVALGMPLLIPAIGASAFLVFTGPTLPTASPRNMMIGHSVGALVGWAMLSVFGLGGVAGGLLLEPSYARIAAAAFALGLTSGILLFLRALHPPAGATTMIVALGLMPKFAHIGAFLLAASFIWLHATLAWRPRGVAYPIWS